MASYPQDSAAPAYNSNEKYSSQGSPQMQNVHKESVSHSHQYPGGNSTSSSSYTQHGYQYGPPQPAQGGYYPTPPPHAYHPSAPGPYYAPQAQPIIIQQQTTNNNDNNNNNANSNSNSSCGVFDICWGCCSILLCATCLGIWSA